MEWVDLRKVKTSRKLYFYFVLLYLTYASQFEHSNVKLMKSVRGYTCLWNIRFTIEKKEEVF